MNQVLVTGANGFIGRHMCQVLSDNDFAVRAAIRRHYQGENLPAYDQVLIDDIGPETQWQELLSGVDFIIHLAARVHIMRDSVSNPLAEFRKVNTNGTLNLARQAAAAGVKRFIYLSSIKVNGEQTQPGYAFTSEDIPAPIDPYGISKYEAEQGLLSIANDTGMEIVIIRPPLVYGPGVKANFFKMMSLLYKGIPMPLGAIHNKRSLVSLDNLVDLILVCIKHTAAANKIFLVSDGEDLSTTTLLERLGQALGHPARLISVPARILNIFAAIFGKKDLAMRLLGSLQVDIDNTKKDLNWTPPVNSDDAFKATAQYFLKQ